MPLSTRHGLLRQALKDTELLQHFSDTDLFLKLEVALFENAVPMFRLATAAQDSLREYQMHV